MIPHVRRLFAEVRALLKLDETSSTSTPLPQGFDFGSNGHGQSGNGHSNGNGKHAQPVKPTSFDEPETASTDYSGWSEEKRHEAAYRLLNALQSQGIVIQDVERGLIDFPTIKDGREVFLCYELSDGLSIKYFHETDAGYAGRQPLSESNE